MRCPSCGEKNPAQAQFCMACGTALAPAAPAREVRKTVTVVFCDVTGSTALGEKLDPETLRKVMARYFEAMKHALERHGGTVEKFIGDAVMAVFGIPVLHEDDALRACRAAAEMHETLTLLNKELDRDFGVTISSRIGVNTGEVVAGTAGQTLATGDAVNVAARLEQAARPGEVLIGEETVHLVRGAVVAEPVEALDLKGKTERVAAFRLVSVIDGAVGRARRMDSPMVGRDRHLALLAQAFEGAVADQACNLFTILGAPGVGKSRLVEEFLLGVGGARVLRGRCLPYGDGITYFPVVEVVKEAAGLADFDAPEVVETKVCATLEGEEQQDAVCGRVSQLLGLGEGSAPEETRWAIRRFFEAQARERPLVLVFDDIHWGEPAFLDLIEHVGDWSRDAPILLLCLARPDLLDLRSSWGGGKLNATTISLEPLTEEECERLVANLVGAAELPHEVGARIAEAAEGNPLFVEEMLSMLIDDGLLVREDGRWVLSGDLSRIAVPPTISALLSARLDRLSPAEREVIERASVVGKVFYRGAVRALFGEHAPVDLHDLLMALVRRELVRPDRSTLPGEDAFRFRHLLIRDAAYEAIPKELRAELHERFADWLERVAGDRIEEQEEILGYHLEQSVMLLRQLGPAGAREAELARRASAHLAAAARRAVDRGDASAAANLFGRAVALAPPDAPNRSALLLELGVALGDAADLERAIAVLEEAISSASAVGDPSTEWRARVEQAWIRSTVETDRPWGDEHRRLVEEAIGVFEHLGDDLGLAKAWFTMAGVHSLLGREGERVAAAERSLLHARRAGRPREIAYAALMIRSGMDFGPTPVREAITRLRELQAEFGHLPSVRLLGIGTGDFEALDGRFEEARSWLEGWRALAREYGDRWALARVAWRRGVVERLAGAPSEAERSFKEAFEAFSAMGERGFLSTLSGELALSLCEQGKHEEALRFAETSKELGGPDDAATQMLLREARARALAGLGDLGEAERSAREAVAIGRATDFWWRADVLVALAEILRAADRPVEARPLVQEALDVYEAKGVLPLVERTRALLVELSS